MQNGEFFSVLCCIRLYALSHKVLVYDMLNFSRMVFLVGDPSNQLIVVHRFLLAQLVDFFHGFLDGDGISQWAATMPAEVAKYKNPIANKVKLVLMISSLFKCKLILIDHSAEFDIVKS